MCDPHHPKVNCPSLIPPRPVAFPISLVPLLPATPACPSGLRATSGALVDTLGFPGHFKLLEAVGCECILHLMQTLLSKL
jgi:hypothetical protein